MGYKKYTDEFRQMVVNEYLAGGRMGDLSQKHEVDPTQIKRWTKKWREYGSFPDNRGKSKHMRKGRPRLHTTVKEAMTKDEYIAYLEMQLEIKKYLAFYEKRKQK
jgi:transposase-like protein